MVGDYITVEGIDTLDLAKGARIGLGGLSTLRGAVAENRGMRRGSDDSLLGPDGRLGARMSGLDRGDGSGVGRASKAVERAKGARMGDGGRNSEDGWDETLGSLRSLGMILSPTSCWHGESFDSRVIGRACSG